MKNDDKVIVLKPVNDRGTAPKNTGANEPAINLPPVTKAMCLLLVAVFLVQYVAPEYISEAMIWWGSFIPARLAAGEVLGFTSLFTYMFLHGGWLHLAANVGMLMAFGAGLEKAMGAKKLSIIYFLGGIGGALVQFIFAPHDLLPLIGASGGVSGLFGALVMLMHARGMMGEGGYGRLLPLIAIWVALSVFFGIFGVPGSESSIAWVVHLGGFFAGLAAYPLLQRRTV